MRKKKSVGQICLYAIILTAAILFSLPVFLTVVASFRANQGKVGDGYAELFFNCFPFYRRFWNSIFYSLLITAGNLLISVLSAYAFKIARFPGKKLVYALYIVLMMMPLQVTLLPNYIGLRDLRMLNTPSALILPLIFSPIGVVLLRQYMEGCDMQVVEAARMETNSHLLIIIHCIIPQIKVCLCAVGLFLFADAWNMVEQPLLYLNDDTRRTLSIFLSQTDQYHSSVLLPASVLFLVPVFLLYLMFRSCKNIKLHI